MSEEVWDEHDWREYVRMQQQLNSKHSNEKGYVPIYQKRIEKCQAFLKKEMDRVEKELEELRQEHGATSDEYTTMHKKFKFLPDIEKQLENIYDEVSAWELLPDEDEEPEKPEEPEEREEPEEDEEDEEFNGHDNYDGLGCMNACPLYEGPFYEESKESEEPEESEENEESKEMTSLDERRKVLDNTYKAMPLDSLAFEIMDREYKALKDNSDDEPKLPPEEPETAGAAIVISSDDDADGDADGDADSQATQKRRRMDD
jgi:hypothetical protein